MGPMEPPLDPPLDCTHYIDSEGKVLGELDFHLWGS